MTAPDATSVASFFEAGMLACFGVSWPVAVLRTWRTKCVSGKSLLFLWLILTGYVSGLCFKFASGLDWVVALYAANLAMVGLDITLYYRYRRSGPSPA